MNNEINILKNEVDFLERALRVAAGMLSTQLEFQNQHPSEVLEYIYKITEKYCDVEPKHST